MKTTLKTSFRRSLAAAFAALSALSMSAQARSYPDYSVHAETSSTTLYTYVAENDTTVPTTISKTPTTRTRYLVTDIATGRYCELYTYLSGRQKRYGISPMSNPALWNTIGESIPPWHEHTQRKTLSPLVSHVLRAENDAGSGAGYRYASSQYQIGTKANVSFTGRSAPLFLITSMKGPYNDWYSASTSASKIISVTSGQTTTTLSKSLTQQALTAPSVYLPGQTLDFATMPHAVYKVAMYLESKGYRR
jgi:hypothetical protein